MTFTLTEEQFEQLMYEQEKHLNATQEIDYFNIQREFDGIERITKKNPKLMSKYKLARYKILQYMINCVKHDGVNGDWYDEENYKLVKEAGMLLYQDSGDKGMHDRLFWSFIPRRYHREIDYAWNGIGQWIS